jgi:hypothetical protein
MSTTVGKSNRKWHPEQEKLFVELLSLPEYKPIGGGGDGVMERKQDTRWAPLLAHFSLENEVLVAGQRHPPEDSHQDLVLQTKTCQQRSPTGVLLPLHHPISATTYGLVLRKGSELDKELFLLRMISNNRL